MMNTMKQATLVKIYNLEKSAKEEKSAKKKKSVDKENSAKVNYSARDMGWVKISESEEKLVKRSLSITDAFRRAILRKGGDLDYSLLWNQVTVEGENRKSVKYGKMFDRIVLSYKPADKNYTIICGMPGAGARYLVYETGKANVLYKLRNIESLADCMVEVFDYA